MSRRKFVLLNFRIGTLEKVLDTIFVKSRQKFTRTDLIVFGGI